MGLIHEFTAYSIWRDQLTWGVQQLKRWLAENDLADARSDVRLEQLLERLKEDRLIVAFVAEFSRGKSELINAIFFADYGSRVLPSSAGRTTMCPTELLHDGARAPAIELLPIESRATNATVADLKRYREEWSVVPLDTEDAAAMHEALSRVSQQKTVTADQARALGFAIDESGEEGLKPEADGTVNIPAWRHAVINFPHPLLKQGLVILDTPGLNAIGTEPELTLSLLPAAHAVLFILAADTGVTHSDLTVWHEHVNGASGRSRGRIVVMNKIDGLWDGLRPQADIDAEIERQAQDCARILELPRAHVFPVSAQKGLVSKINRDPDLLAASRLPLLEQSLSAELIPAKRDIVGEDVRSETADLAGHARGLLDARLRSLAEQLHELADLRGKNRGVVDYMMRKVKFEKDEFEKGLQQYYAVRSVFSSLSNELLAQLGVETARAQTRRTREAMLHARFSKNLREAMAAYFVTLRGQLVSAGAQVDEIVRMLDAMYKRFSVEHGMKLAAPAPFALLRYFKELDRLENAFNRHINTLLNMLTLEKRTLSQKFFETIATQARRLFEQASRDAEYWLRSAMAPLDTQVREYQLQLKRRLENVKRITQATATLDERIAELDQARTGLDRQLADLANIEAAIAAALAGASVRAEAA